MQILLALFSYRHHETLALLGAQMTFEVVRGYDAPRAREQVLLRLIVLARRHEGALWAPLVVEQVALEVHG